MRLHIVKRSLIRYLKKVRPIQSKQLNGGDIIGINIGAGVSCLSLIFFILSLIISVFSVNFIPVLILSIIILLLEVGKAKDETIISKKEFIKKEDVDVFSMWKDKHDDFLDKL